MTTSKGGRPATGWVKWRKGQWWTQITLSTGKRSPFIALHPDIPQHDRARAVACAKGVSDEARASGMVPDTVTETVEEYARRWAAARRTAGLGCVDGDGDTLTRHLFPIIGKQDVRTIGRDDLKKLVAELDAKARRGFSVDAATGKRRPFGWKTASNVWSVGHALMRDGGRSKDVGLVRARRQPRARSRRARRGRQEGEGVPLAERVSTARQVRAGAPSLAAPLRGGRLHVRPRRGACGRSAGKTSTLTTARCTFTARTTASGGARGAPRAVRRGAHRSSRPCRPSCGRSSSR